MQIVYIHLINCGSRAACRLALLELSGSRMLLKSPAPERDYDMAKLRPVSLNEPCEWTAKRTKKTFPRIVDLVGTEGAPHNDKALKYLLSRALTEPANSPLELVSKLAGHRKVAEYLHILRPLIFGNCHD
jgi:peroxin-16